MIIATSLSPVHTNSENQINAIKSWSAICPGKIYSINARKEIDILQTKYDGVKFVETTDTIEYLVGKPLVKLNHFFMLAREMNEDLIIINSDIILTVLPELKQDGISIFSRYDYIENMDDNKMFMAGFDCFYIPKQFLGIFPPTIYALGMAFHDFSTPYRAILNNIPVYYPKGKFCFHKLHPIHYSFQEWEYIGQYFMWEFKMNKQLSIGEMCTQTLTYIKQKMIVI